MGLVICPKHGSGFMFVCPHIVDAVRSSTACPGIKNLNYTTDDSELLGISDACWFCPQCVQTYHLPPTESVIPAPDLDDFLRQTGHLYQPMCPGCFKDWLANGLGY